MPEAISGALPPEQTGAAAWYGPAMARRDDWLMPLGAAEIAEIEARLISELPIAPRIH